jgi:nicotinate-nucleotide pyrophosphorylase (carboxylating)
LDRAAPDFSSSAYVMDEATRENAAWLIDKALAEDFGSAGDLTSQALIPADAMGDAEFVARSSGIVCGIGVCAMIIAKHGAEATLRTFHRDGEFVNRGEILASIQGSARTILGLERTCLNFLGHLSGISTLTHQFVQAVAGTSCTILDTRKTLPGWRRLAKFAVRCGGGQNHRMGLFDAILIKDNHLALCSGQEAGCQFGIEQAVHVARQWSQRHGLSKGMATIEVEVTSVELYRRAIAAHPDIVLLDNMELNSLRQCVQIRNEQAPKILLEASGGVTLATVSEIAQTGVDRISIGALTHSAPNLDMALDWQTTSQE